MSVLHGFEGDDVIGTRVAVTNAGDGLSKALAIDAVELRIGATVFIVIEAKVGKVGFEPIKDTDSLVRIQTLKAGTATLVERELVEGVLAAQRKRIDDANGVQSLDFAPDDDDGDDDAEG